MLNCQDNKLKSGIKNGNEVISNLSSHVIGDSNNETSFLLKLILTGTQVLRLRKTLVNNSPANIKLLKSQLSKMLQSGAFFGRLLGPLCFL